MKKKLLSLVLAVCLIFPCAFIFSACGNKGETPETSSNDSNSPSGSAVVYTVSESEWDLNFKITQVRSQAQPQAMSCSLLNNVQGSAVQMADATLAEITSYTLTGTGTVTKEGITESGLGILKVAPNGLDMEFYVGGVQKEEETKTILNTDPQYIGLKAMLTSYFAFSGKYSEFTFDTTKNAYVAQNLTVTVVDEDDPDDTYDLFNKNVEVTFRNGYLNTISVVICDDDTYSTVYATYLFTFTDINNTTVVI